MKNTKITRRVFIGGSLCLISATALSSVVSASNQFAVVKQNGQFFSGQQLSMLQDIADIMLPRTSTPSASDVNVTAVLDSLMISYAGNKTKSQIPHCIAQIEEQTTSEFGAPYSTLALSDRTQLIAKIDKMAFSDKKTTLSKSYRTLKKLVYHLYYTSEAVNPDYRLIPGTYKGCLNKSELDAILARGYA